MLSGVGLYVVVKQMSHGSYHGPGSRQKIVLLVE
jgi:hypothetical protein